MTRPVLRQRLLEFYSEAEMRVFLKTPQPLLHDQTPADLILTGRGEEIHLMLDRLENGVFV